MVEYIIGSAAFLIACRIAKRNEAKLKGAIGERRLSHKLKRLHLPGKVSVIRDALLPADWGTSQVDAIAVTRYGIIVCEMKNYSAKIFGDISVPNWNAVYGENNTQPLSNPVHQNHSHVMSIRNLLQRRYPHMNYIPLVVFSNQAKLHVQHSRNKVCKLGDLKKVVHRIVGEPKFTDQQVEDIAKEIRSNLIKGRQARKNHVTAIDLRRETEQLYSKAYMKQVENQLRTQAKQKPIFSSTGIRPEPTPKPAFDPNDNRPLCEILNMAKSRTNTSKPNTPPEHTR